MATILTGNEFTNSSIAMVSATVAYDLIALYRSPSWWMVTLLTTLLATPMVFLFGEVLPKTFAVRNPETYGRLVARPLALFAKIISPFRHVFQAVADLAASPFVAPDGGGRDALVEEEFRTLVDVSEQEGVLDSRERLLIHRIFEFGDTPVSSIMTPRTDLFCLSYSLPLGEIIKVVQNSHYSRIPIYRNRVDNIVGILYAKDLMRFLDDASPPAHLGLQQILRQPYFVPGGMKADTLFREFQSRRQHLAVVVDEYGGVEGVVTMDDLLEEVFGRITPSSDDPDDVSDWTHTEEGGGVFLISPRLPIDEFNELVGADVPDENHDTMGGFVFDLFGELPKAGESVEYDELRFIVEELEDTRILRIRVEPLAGGGGESDETPAPEKS